MFVVRLGLGKEVYQQRVLFSCLDSQQLDVVRSLLVSRENQNRRVIVTLRRLVKQERRFL